MLRILTLLTLTLVVHATTSAQVTSATLLVTAHLDGSRVVPNVSTQAQGVASLTITPDRTSIIVQVDMTGLSGQANGAFIREGAKGTNGPAVFDLTPYIRPNNKRISTTLTGNDLAQISLAKLLKGSYYITVRTAAHPDGEIRGELRLESDHGLRAILTGSQETPPVATTAQGVAVLDLGQDDSILTVRVLTSGLSGAITGAHLHRGAPGEAGPVVLNLTHLVNGSSVVGTIDTVSGITGDLLSGNLYINIHTAANPDGELRGQVMLDSGIALDAMLNGAMEVPPVTTPGNALATLSLSPGLDTLYYLILATDLSGPISAAHFHRGGVGETGPPLVNLATGITGNVIAGSLSGDQLNERFINDLLSGDLYLNLHTGDHTDGEVRGQIYPLVRDGYVFTINGTQEVPSNLTGALGGGIVSIDRDRTNAHYMLVAGGFNSDVAGVHFHEGTPGTNGEIIRDLTTEFADSAIVGYWRSTDSVPFTPAVAERFLSNQVYVNFHTLAYTRGEARGNVVRVGSFTEEPPLDPNFSGRLVFTAALNGSNLEPPVSTPATGLAAFSLNAKRDSMFASITVDGLTGPITRVLLRTMDTDTNRRYVHDITPYFGGNRASFALTGIDLTKDRLARFFSEDSLRAYHIIVETAQNPAGEIAGMVRLETDRMFVGGLNGNRETPPLPNVTATGLATVTVSQDSSRIFVHGVFNGLSGAITGAHLHRAFAGENGDVIVNLTPFVRGNVLDAALDSVDIPMRDLVLGGIYLNVHTEAHPDGEIRGQLFPVPGLAFDGLLDPSQEVPPTPSALRGLVVMTIDPTLDTLSYQVFLSGLSGSLEHIVLHQGGVGKVGKILYDFPFNAANNPVSGRVDIGRSPVLAIAQRMLEGTAYVSIKTTAFPDGEGRAQIFRVARDGFAFELCGEQELSPVTTPASGSGVVAIDRYGTNAHFTVQATKLSGPITGAHFHSGTRTDLGPVVKGVTGSFNGTFADGYWDDNDSGQTFTTAMARAIKNDSIYFNIHTAANSGGEIRGQVANDVRCETGVASAPIIEKLRSAAHAYPNPAESRITFAVESRESYTALVSLTDMRGRTVARTSVPVESGVNEFRVDLTGLPSGSYLIDLERDGVSVATEKVIKK